MSKNKGFKDLIILGTCEGSQVRLNDHLNFTRLKDGFKLLKNKYDSDESNEKNINNFIKSSESIMDGMLVFMNCVNDEQVEETGSISIIENKDIFTSEDFLNYLEANYSTEEREELDKTEIIQNIAQQLLANFENEVSNAYKKIQIFINLAKIKLYILEEKYDSNINRLIKFFHESNDIISTLNTNSYNDYMKELGKIVNIANINCTSKCSPEIEKIYIELNNIFGSEYFLAIAKNLDFTTNTLDKIKHPLESDKILNTNKIIGDLQTQLWSFSEKLRTVSSDYYIDGYHVDTQNLKSILEFSTNLTGIVNNISNQISNFNLKLAGSIEEN